MIHQNVELFCRFSEKSNLQLIKPVVGYYTAETLAEN